MDTVVVEDEMDPTSIAVRRCHTERVSASADLKVFTQSRKAAKKKMRNQIIFAFMLA